MSPMVAYAVSAFLVLTGAGCFFVGAACYVVATRGLDIREHRRLKIK